MSDLMRSLLEAQAEWLAPARARLLRWVHVARRRRILDLGAGYGAVTAELVRRGGGTVCAVDLDLAALGQAPAAAFRVGANAQQLPFPDRSFDLIFTQCALMWMAPLDITLHEVFRLLEPGGVLVSLEPDYGGMIEHPAELATGPLWRAALTRAGAEPLAGRRLPGLLSAQGFEVQVNLLDQLRPPAVERFEFLRTLPLTPAETRQLKQIEQTTIDDEQQAWSTVAHLPFMLIRATKRRVSDGK